MSSPNPAEITGLNLLQNLVKEHEDKILSLTKLINDLRIRLNETEDELRSLGLLPEPPYPYSYNCEHPVHWAGITQGVIVWRKQHGSL